MDDSGVVQGFGLRDGAREAVEDEPRSAIGLVEPFADHGDDQVVGHELAGLHDSLGLAAEHGSRAHRRAQHVAARNLRDAEVLGEKPGLGAFARSRTAE